jgi:HlyD family secretion protein
MWINRRLSIVAILIVVAPMVLVALLLQNGTRQSGDLGPARADMPVFVVKPGKFEGKLVETGWVWADSDQEVLGPGPGHATIKRIVPDGTRVKKGEFVCELDLSELKSDLSQALVAAREAEAAYQNARRDREAAETALSKMAKQKLSSDDEPTILVELELDQKRSEETSKLSTWNRAKKQVGEYPSQIADCKTIYAPADGPVVLAYQTHPESPRSLLEVGAEVSEWQRILNIFDVNREIRVLTKVPRLMIESVRVKPGLTARVTFDGFPERPLSGIVEEVAPLPDPGFRDIRYSTYIKIEKGFSGLRPRMMAKVEIDLGEIDNALTVPVEAVVHERGNDLVAVRNANGGFDRHEATLGATTGKLVEVVRGIQTGDLVALEPTDLLIEKEVREKGGRPTKRVKQGTRQ